MKIKIKVTKDILDRSKLCGTNKLIIVGNCAIALAVRDIFPQAGVSAGDIYPFASNGDVYSMISLPLSARSFIRAFDNFSPEGRIKMKPISFEIEVPEEIINCIGIPQVESILSNSLTLEKV